jgi:hypothetical protein
MPHNLNIEASPRSGRRVADRDGRVARATHSYFGIRVEAGEVITEMTLKHTNAQLFHLFFLQSEKWAGERRIQPSA